MLCLVVEATSYYPPMAPEVPIGGSVRIDLILKRGARGRESELNTVWLNDRNVTMLTGGVKMPSEAGVSGEIVAFKPANGCQPFQTADEHGRLILKGEQGEGQPVIALIDGRGNECDWLTRINNAAKVSNVVGVLIYADRPNGGKEGQFAVDNPDERETVPSFIVSSALGEDLLNRIEGTRRTPDLDWIRATLLNRFQPSPLMNMIQYILIGVVLFILLAFLLSMAVHYRLYRHFDRRQEKEEPKIDEAFLAQLPLRRFQDTSNDAAGVPSGKADRVDKIDKVERAEAPVETIQDWVPISNELCSICLDDFVHGEVVNVLPCGHGYHPDCIQPWLLHRAPYCPLCKKDVRQPAPNPYHEHVPLVKRIFGRRSKKDVIMTGKYESLTVRNA